MYNARDDSHKLIEKAVFECRQSPPAPLYRSVAAVNRLQAVNSEINIG